MELRLLVFFTLLFCISASIVVNPTGDLYVKSNIQLMCTDDDTDINQPQWISPSKTLIGEFQPHTANCESAPQCDDDSGVYCENALASCVDGRCVCQQFGINPCTCLVALGDCYVVRGNSSSIAVATLKNNIPLQYTSCESRVSATTEVHVIAMQYGIGSPDSTTVNVNILNRKNNKEKDVVLVLVSDRLVFWKINIQNNETIDRLVQLSRYQNEDNLDVDKDHVIDIHKPKDVPYGIGDDAEFGGKTVDMLLYLEERYGRVTSFTGTYTANAWDIEIDLAKSKLKPYTQHNTVVFTENVYPWKTKLSIVGIQNEDDYGTYICKGKNSQSNVTIIKKEPILINAPRLQNLTFRENGTIRCIVLGSPTPDVTWSFNGNVINKSAKYNVLQEGSLMITSAVENDAGKYFCRGIQQNDKRTASIDLTILHKKPNAPVIWQSEEDIDSYTANININSSNSLDELLGFHYNLYYNGQQLNILSGVYHRINIPSLKPSTVYRVYSVAVSKGGTSDKSNCIAFTTHQDSIVKEENSDSIEGNTQRLVEIDCWWRKCVMSSANFDILNEEGFSLKESDGGCAIFHDCIRMKDSEFWLTTYICTGQNFNSLDFHSSDTTVTIKVYKRWQWGIFQREYLKTSAKYRIQIC